MTRRLAVAFLALVCLRGVAAAAQDAPVTEAPAHISQVDGPALLERDGQIDRDLTSMPILAGDRLRTEGGRVEVLFADGSALHLDAGTVIDFQSDEVVRLIEGRVRLAIAGPARELFYRVDAPAAWVQITEPGEYKVAVTRAVEVELAVLRGAAELVNEQGRSYIRAGERAVARAASAPSAPFVYNSAAWDAFDHWSEARRDARLGASAQYLPSDVRPYAAAFDRHGSWRHEADYGHVWYPRVEVGWRPYHRGRWVSLRPYGWTWVGGDAWAWPTHHYGRWGLSAGAWFWIPGRQWSPAWVSWAYASDYVSWCALGWNNRPVLQIFAGGSYGGRRHSPWDAWTVLPRRHFGGSHINVRGAGAFRVDDRVHRTFVVRDRGPEPRYAASRSTAPIRSAGRYAVPRGGQEQARPGADSGQRADRSRAAGPRTAASAAGASDARVTRSAPESSILGQPAGDGAGAASRRSGALGARRAGDAQPSTGPAAAITEAPAGAVPARPRRVSPAATGVTSSPVDSETTRSRGRVYESAPRSQPPSPRRSDTIGSDRPAADLVATPEAGSSYRRRSAPQAEAPVRRAIPDDRPAQAVRPERELPSYRRQAPESRPAPAPRGEYRSAPERRAPSAPSPSAAPSSRPSGGERSPDAGGARRRGGDGAPSGQARRR